MATLLLKSPSLSPRRVSLERTPLSIGRDPTNDLVLDHRTVSRRHAVIERRRQRYWFRDRSSRNGSAVNGDRVSERSLRDGDLLALGDVQILFREDLGTGDRAEPVGSPGPASRSRCPLCHVERGAEDRPGPERDAWIAAPGRAPLVVCASCGAAEDLPARFCTVCGARLLSVLDRAEAFVAEPGPPLGASGPVAALAAEDGPLAPDPWKTDGLAPEAGSALEEITWNGGGLGSQLTAQQASLVRAVVLRRADYLLQSYYRDTASGQRFAHPLAETERSRFAARWAVEPVECIRAMNAAIAELRAPARIRRYLKAAVELETLMDRRALRATEGRVFAGIPGYLMDGYTDMGRNSSPTERYAREKIKVDKERLKPWLIAARWRALAYDRAPEELLAGFYEAVRRSLSHDESRVVELSRGWESRSVALSRYLDEGVGVCRHMSILYQLCLQEAGIPARVVKGDLHFFGIGGRHAWNVAWLAGRVALVDVTLPNPDGPLILVGASLAEVYEMARACHRRYVPTPDAQNHYKIGRPSGELTELSRQPLH